MANEMADGTLDELGIHIPIEQQITIQLRNNH